MAPEILLKSLPRVGIANGVDRLELAVKSQTAQLHRTLSFAMVINR